MLPALKAALADATATGDLDMLRQVIFRTDGEVSNEQEMLATLGADGGRSHIFFIGIGSAPNDHLMTRMATIGRGTFTHVSSTNEVAARITPLLDRLRRPAMQHLAVKVSGGSLDLTPRLLPNLYFGEPLLLVGKTGHLAGTLTVSGTIAGRLWQRSIDLASAQVSPAVAKLWARRRIDDIGADRTLGKIDEKAANRAVEEVGLTHSLVTSQTSLVAVDTTPTRPAGQGLAREELPINLPAGWDFDHLFGGESGKAAMANADTLAARAAEQAIALDLPKTATGFASTIASGLALLLAGLAWLFLARRRSVTR